MDHFDIVVVADPRFSGGTASALIADVMAFCSAGAKVGFLPVTSRFFDGSPEKGNSEVLGLVDQPGVHLLEPQGKIHARTAFLHHPLTFFHSVSEKVRIQAESSVVVAHHPPFRGDGSLEYDPISTARQIHKAFGLRPKWAPVSGVIRRHLCSFLPFIRLTTQDWVNIFDTANWTPGRKVFEGPESTVGRHSRADLLKWPDAPIDVTLPLTVDGWKTRVMGCPVSELSACAADLEKWEILEFNAEPVDVFLDSLDVFCYFYSNCWVEAFGRTIVEAMLMERPCVLDPRLRETFGDLALYCSPPEAPGMLQTLRANPFDARRQASVTRETVSQRYASAAVPRRLSELNADPGIVMRLGSSPPLVPPIVTLRKAVGLMRRRRSSANKSRQREQSSDGNG